MKRTLYTLLSIGLMVLLSSCGNSEKDASKTTEAIADNRIKISKAQFEQNNMAFGTIEKKQMPLAVTANGMIDVPPENRAFVNAIMGGYIKTTPLLIGDFVKKGQRLVTLENPDFVSIQQEYMEVKGQLDYLKSEYDRQNTMMDENITSKKNFMNAESNYKTAMAKYNGLHKQLTMLNISPSSVEQGNISSIISIYAPISGSITKVNVSKGSYVSPATAIMEIVDNDHIHIELSVFEKDIMKIKKGQDMTFKIPESSDEVYDGTVYLVGTSIEANRTIKVHGHPKDEANRFLTGMFVNAEIITGTEEANALPETAIVEMQNEHFIMILDEENDDTYNFKKVTVDLINTSNGFTFLKESEALKSLDKILTKGAFGILVE
ncbi:MAG: efflux RND transporter periplasmic adaptor subunit [Flavobacteriaceae bacterium]|nr:efflux RND transporter periplasmic adaptor subunit [Bacteroidia bacterium]NND10972.1 efflux RND transporter periplasmic adaptor subunit [Flavobacteriaceae bacterium]NNL61038.1 efflux RND transporter periplasmic adaptor subunit [Flavobacteriaceae bacterium]